MVEKKRDLLIEIREVEIEAGPFQDKTPKTGEAIGAHTSSSFVRRRFLGFCTGYLAVFLKNHSSRVRKENK
jgi:hypothetical protein